jgi:hypothetical protein
MRALVLLACVASCTEYARVARHNAPGMSDVSTPPEREDGTDTLYIPPGEPGEHSVNLIVAPYFSGGLGRDGAGGELGADVMIERSSSRYFGGFGEKAWGAAIGVGVTTFADDTTGYGTDWRVPGALSLEGYRRWLVFTVGGGAVAYPDEGEFGGQITGRAGIAMLRFRYVSDSGFEAMLGIVAPVPFLFGWSR